MGDPILDESGHPIQLDARRMFDSAAEDPFFGRYPEAVRKRRWFGRGETASGQLIPREDLIAAYRIDRSDR